jgi:hypothetical protein
MSAAPTVVPAGPFVIRSGGLGFSPPPNGRLVRGVTKPPAPVLCTVRAQGACSSQFWLGTK